MSHDTPLPSLPASRIEDTAAQRLTGPDQSGVYISDRFAYSQREQLKLLHLISHRRETRGFLGILYHLNSALIFKESTSPLPSSGKSTVTLVTFGACN